MEYARTSTPTQCALRNTGYTYSHSSSYTTSALQQQTEKRVTEATIDPPRMSRRSLRLHTSSCHYGDDSLLDSSLNHSSVSYTSGSSSRRESRTLKHRRQHQSVSGSQSLLHTPRKSESGSARLAHTSLHSCAASDSSLLSSMLDESCIQERTLVDSFWGLDEETDHRDCSMRLERSAIADRSVLAERSAIADRSILAERSTMAVNGDTHTAQTQTSVLNGYMCGDCSMHSERRDALTAYSSSKHASSPSPVSAAASRSASYRDSASASSPVSSTIYSLDKSRRHKTGLLASASNHLQHYSSRALAYVVSIATLLAQSIPPKLKEGRGVLGSLSESWLYSCMRAGSSLLGLATTMAHGARMKMHQIGSDVSAQAHQLHCRSANVKQLMASEGPLDLNGSLCDDCKGKQHQETLDVQAQSSRAGRLKGAVWHTVAFAGHSLLWAVQAVGSAGWFVIGSLLSVLRLATASPGKAAAGVFWWLGTAWYQLVTLASVLNVFILTRVLPKLWKLLLFLLPLLLLLGLCYWGPATMLSCLPAVNLGTFTPLLLYRQLPHSPPALPPIPSEDLAAGISGDSEWLSRLEQNLAQLWEGVQGGSRLQEQQHREVLGLYSSLQEQLDKRMDRDGLGLWVSGLLEERLTLLKGELEQDGGRQQEIREKYTEELRQRRSETTTAAPVSVGTDSKAHSALLGQVQKLEAALGRIRQDLQGVIGCRGQCERLDGLQDTVSAQIKLELRELFYGSAQTHTEDDLPEPLLPWLTAQFASGSDLRATLAALENSILGNLSLQLEQREQQLHAETVAQTVTSTAGAAGMSEEQVQLIIKNALNLYSQDRTGLVDYALESGGGSILSTRCSETYETKTALMSLFGLPLWYFSQSPRVVIQPDVNPGNCWAFKGFQGYLVIRLSLRVRPTAFSLEHIPKSLSPTGNISSAPRQFSVYGLDDQTQEEGTELGQYTYEEEGDPLQTFPVMVENEQVYQIIEVKVQSNWGHPEYTCLYRFRVHGEPERS
ncbi:hypothetical protein GJAV_G00265440 [Gymnothorax javanicus]|nr:hypothetical protein GJAV_G00265440 [Gymnothorax javanicus]